MNTFTSSVFRTETMTVPGGTETILRGGRDHRQHGKDGNGDKRSGGTQQRHGFLLRGSADGRDMALV